MPSKGGKGKGRGRGRGRGRGSGGQGNNPRPGETSGQRDVVQARSQTQVPQERQQAQSSQHQGQRKQQQQRREEPLEERTPLTSERPSEATASTIPHSSQSESESTTAVTQQSETKQQSPVQGATALDETTEKLSQLTTSSSVGYTKRAEEDEIRYPNRPNYGTVGRQIKLRSNFFPLTLPRNDFIYHYDVAIEPEAVKPVYREIMKLLYKKYAGEAFGNAEPAYDGVKNLYTLKNLPVGRDGAKLNVVLPSRDGKKSRTFTVKIKFAAKVFLKDLKDFLARKGGGTRPQEPLMTMDILLRHIPSIQFEAIGRGAFFPQNTEGIPIGDGVELRFGFYQSVRHSEWNTVLVNVDVCAKAFYRKQPLLGYICEVLNIGERDLQNPGLFSNRRVQQDLRDAIYGLRVETTHCDIMRRKFVIGGITQKSANQETFEFEGKQVTVQQYMREKYNVNLRYPNLPCIKKQGGNALFPFETLEVVPCVKKKITDDQTAKMIRETARPAFERQRNISDWAKQLEGMNRSYLNKEFGMKMESQMVNVEGRVLPTPVLALGGRENHLTPRDGSWDMRGKQFYNGVTIEKWAIVLFVPEQRCRADVVRKFASMFQETSRKEGVMMKSGPIDVKYERPQGVEAVLCALTAKHPDLQFIFCVLPDTKKALYGEIKRVGDNVIGVVTQCIQQKFVYQPKPQVCSNVAMKVNAKLGGINHVIHKDGQAPVFKEPVIIFGADVTHPMSGDTVSPSIAAVVASVDLQGSKYTSIVRAQASKKNKPSKKSETAEIIENLDEIVKELLIRYRQNTKVAPTKILFYRDGVSEGQFEQVYLYELRAIQKACLSLSEKYKPGITLVIVQKRHHARLFCADRQDQVGKAGNVPPGTTVDKGIVHPYEFDFYLCSHFGIQGTSRPAHYHVLHDDNKFTADHLQQVTNELCYTFARCTRAISIPAPAYYAHLVAFRARYHMRSEKYYNGKQPKPQEEILHIVNRDIKIEEKHGKTMYFT